MPTRLGIAMVLVAAACAQKEPTMDPNDTIPIACVLTGLTPEQRDREGVLLHEHLASVQEVREREDGFAFRYPPDAALFARMAELVTLEHRCCPFLVFQLEWGRGDAAPWLTVTGGARVKDFVSDTFSVTHR